MTSFSAYLQSNPIADNAPAPSVTSKAMGAVKGYVSGIKDTVASNYNEASQAVKASGNGSVNPFAAGATVFKDIAGSLASPITQALAPAANASGLTSASNSVTQAFLNSPAGQTLVNALSKHPQVSGAIADTLQGALDTSAIAGTPEAIESVKAGIKGLKPSTVDTVSSRVADATPAYDKSLIGQNTRTPEGTIVPRINEARGISGQRTVNTSASEAESGKALAELKDYPDKGTALEKSLATGKGIGVEAESMRSGLQLEDKATPLDAAAEKTKVNDLVRSQLPPDIQEKLGVLTSEDQTMLKGMSEKAGAPLPENGQFDLSAPGESSFMPKTAAGRYYQKVLDALKEYNGTREGKLDLRQKIEKAYQSEGGKYAYGSDSHNALAEVNTDIRNGLNKDLADTTKNTNTQASLKKQTDLYRAKEVLESKAKDEAASEIGRFYQRHPFLHRLATRDFMRVAATASGAGLLGSYITKVLQGKE